DRFTGCRNRVYLIALGFKRREYGELQRGIVFNQQQLLHQRRSAMVCDVAGAAAGTERVKHEPAPGWLTTSMRPPCCSTICWTIDNPIPVPTSPDASALAVR